MLTKSGRLLVVHLIVSLVKLAGPGGVRGLLAETLLLKHQLLIVNRGRKRAYNLSFVDRMFFGLGCLMMYPSRIRKIGIVVSPARLFTFHAALVKRKYRRLFSSSTTSKKPGPKGPPEAIIQALVEIKRRNATRATGVLALRSYSPRPLALRSTKTSFDAFWPSTMVVMDQHTHRIIGFGVQVAAVDGLALCRMFN